MNPRFQRIFDIATIRIQTRMMVIQEKYGNVQGQEGRQPRISGESVQDNGSPVEGNQQGGIPINGTGDTGSEPSIS